MPSTPSPKSRNAPNLASVETVPSATLPTGCFLTAAFYKPTSGVITVDGVDLSRVCLASYRAQLAAVLQDTFLFDGTIRDNVAYSRPHASEYEIQSACRMARVDEFAERMPARYDTMVGAHGVRLSGGQRQRISIARAILADPRILILDEATSNLDSESEALIQESLSYLMAGRTTFVIAHRLSTVRSATQILYIEDGRILERGSHEFLYALGGRYFDLCHRQQNALESNIFAERRPDIGCAGYSPQSATAHL
jgi:ABC-type multidrug transport system fused ATPase/permease subunit